MVFKDQADFQSDDQASSTSSAHYYYVDEAGDPSLFKSKTKGKAKIIVGENGCSRFFILGKIDVRDPEKLAVSLSDLRQEVLADPYFSSVPSMKPEGKKTALMFHAKDDIPEVRQRVFKLLMTHDLHFHAAVRDKLVIAQKVLEHNQKNPNYRYHPNQLYDSCIPILFENRLHKHDAYRIVFARRGSSDRTDAFEAGLLQAKNKVRQKWGIESSAPIEVIASNPKHAVCLQAVDYFLWALQRCYERNEHRYLEFIWEKVSLVIDRDDTREKPTGEYYPRRRPIKPGFRK